MAFQERDRDNGGMVDKLVGVRRVAKTIKGGRRFAFAATVVVGDENGRVGYGTGKAREVPEAVRKATDAAKRSMIRVPLRSGRTLHHNMNGHAGAAKVILQPAKPGTGIIAGGPMRAVFEAMGIKDVVSKSMGSNNPLNMIRATFDAFEKLETPRHVAAKRGLKVSDLSLHKELVDAEMVGAPEVSEKPKKEEKKADEKKKASKKPAKGKQADKKEAKPKKADKKEEAKPAVKTESKQEKMKELAKAKADDKPAEKEAASKKEEAKKAK